VQQVKTEAQYEQEKRTAARLGSLNSPNASPRASPTVSPRRGSSPERGVNFAEGLINPIKKELGKPITEQTLRDLGYKQPPTNAINRLIKTIELEKSQSNPAFPAKTIPDESKSINSRKGPLGAVKLSSEPATYSPKSSLRQRNINPAASDSRAASPVQFQDSAASSTGKPTAAEQTKGRAASPRPETAAKNVLDEKLAAAQSLIDKKNLGGARTHTRRALLRSIRATLKKNIK
jgi:hypothetical protein